MTKNNRPSSLPGAADEQLEQLLHAVALVILRRQMRGKWSSKA